MSKFPDFSELGYQVERELGQNRAGGRATYLAINTNTQLPVVVKQFQFAQLGSSWSEYDAYQREVEVLQRLNHPSIPRYLDSFETPTGFCLVQEYKPAFSLAQPCHWTLEEIEQIAVAVLEVLVYLQQQHPFIIHRDIKPENIIVDRQEKLKVYLIDFGFARMGSGEVAVSSVVKGTLGFMPPEQLFNRQLTQASDLYSLGATLICMLTQTKSTEIGNLIDETYRITFRQLTPQLSPQFISWLEKTVAPNLKNRYSNAAVALESLQIAVIGNAPKPSNICRATKIMIMMIGPVLGLVTLGPIIFGTIITSSQTSKHVKINNRIKNERRLLETKHCAYCNLQGANLEGAKLHGANLEGAKLHGANLKNTELGNAYLRGAYLRGANLEGANLQSASLKNAHLEGADLENANLDGADLDGASLKHTRLKGANLSDSD